LPEQTAVCGFAGKPADEQPPTLLAEEFHVHQIQAAKRLSEFFEGSVLADP